jgi:hypothetical protein
MGGRDKIAHFLRLFMGTGVGHCGGGVGPNVIGGEIAPVRDEKHDIVEAVVHWLETNEAPETIIASRIDADGRLLSQRPWCTYPALAKWDGIGNRNNSTSYQCKMPQP